MFCRPIVVSWQVVAVTTSGLAPRFRSCRTCHVLSLPPELGTMQSYPEPFLGVVSRSCRSAFRREAQSMLWRLA